MTDSAYSIPARPALSEEVRRAVVHLAHQRALAQEEREVERLVQQCEDWLLAGKPEPELLTILREGST